jgi:hypothetical protein
VRKLDAERTALDAVRRHYHRSPDGRVVEVEIVVATEDSPEVAKCHSDSWVKTVDGDGTVVATRIIA